MKRSGICNCVDKARNEISMRSIKFIPTMLNIEEKQQHTYMHQHKKNYIAKIITKIIFLDEA